MEKIRIALIGAGQIAQVTHIPNFLKMEEVEIVSICDTNENAVKEVSEKFLIKKYFTNHKTMLKEVKPDVAVICVPNKFHYQITMDALEASCHVLCEKPPAISAEEALSMEKSAAEKGLLLSYGFHFRHSKEVILLKQKIKNGELGTIYSAKASWLRRRGIPGWGNFTNKEMQGGGPLIDIGAHMLDVALYLMDYPDISYVCANENNYLGKSASAGLMGQWNKSSFTVEDSLFGFIQFCDGYSLTLETSFALNQKEKDIREVKLYGDKLGANVFPLEVYGEEKGVVTNTSYPYFEDQDRHFDCARNFINACRKQEELLITASQGTYIQKVICSLYKSAKEGKPIFIK